MGKQKGGYNGGSSVIRLSPLGLAKGGRKAQPGVRIGGHTKKRKAAIAAAKAEAAKREEIVTPQIVISRKDAVLAQFKTFAEYQAAMTQKRRVAEIPALGLADGDRMAMKRKCKLAGT